MYNLTQLNPFQAIERHVIHRDMLSHIYRWSHVLKVAKIGMNILDFGCGSGNLAELLYRNRYKANQYLGLDVRKQTIEKNKEKFKKVPWIDFKNEDLINISSNYCNGEYEWDIIACFEVIEHIGKENGDKLLQNIKNHMSKDTLLLISTPCFNGKAAANHIVNGEVSEYTFDEMKLLLSKYFEIEKVYGTFASQSDYKGKLNDPEYRIFNKLYEYYDSNMLSVIFAPLFPEASRNCIWKCKIKQGVETNEK